MSSTSLSNRRICNGLRELADKLSKDPAVDYVEPNYIVRHTGIPNDPKWDKQWALPKIEAAKAWDTAVGSDSVVVAVIDTGIVTIIPISEIFGKMQERSQEIKSTTTAMVLWTCLWVGFLQQRQ